jgi:hypothetical protein
MHPPMSPREPRACEPLPHDPTRRPAYANAPVGEPNPVKEATEQVRHERRYEIVETSWKGGLIDILT